MARPQLLVTASLVLAAAAALSIGPYTASAAVSGPFEGPVPTARCGPGSSPETGQQGEVPLADRESGRSTSGYRCNMELVGQYQGQGTTWVSQSFDTCAYHSQSFPTSLATDKPGVHVVDVRNPTKPILATRLTSPAFLGNTWESLKVNERRKLLAGVQVGPLLGAAFFDIYDISDCLHPRLLNSVGTDELTLPANGLGHEGNFSPDGKTYWATSSGFGGITAIDVAAPSSPKVLLTGTTGLGGNHGFSLSPDGNRMYLAGVNPNGLLILDVSDIQGRRANPQLRKVGSVFWHDGTNGQHAVPVTYGGRPHVIFVDELTSGAARIIDVGNETAPRIVSKLKLQIHMPEAAKARAASAGSGVFGYDGHYCAVDRPVNPTAAACGYFESGVRVFDIRDPRKPSEIAYFNPPAQMGKADKLPGSEHAQSAVRELDLSADWCSSPPRFVGKDQLWVTCQDNGFMVLRFTNNAFPLAKAATASGRSAAPAAARPAGQPAASPRPGFAGRTLPATGSPTALAVASLFALGAAATVRRSGASRA